MRHESPMNPVPLRSDTRDTALYPEEKLVDRKERTRTAPGMFIGVIEYLRHAGCSVTPSADKLVTLVYPEGTISQYQGVPMTSPEYKITLPNGDVLTEAHQRWGVVYLYIEKEKLEDFLNRHPDIQRLDAEERRKWGKERKPEKKTPSF